MSLQQAQLEGLCLRFPETLPLHPSLSYETALNMLLRAVVLSNQIPYHWGYIDKPAEGQVFLLFLQPHIPFPNDGIRWREQETRYSVTIANGREMEVLEVKFGFVPNSQDTTAWRMRRRYRLNRGGHPHLVLVHYTRGKPMPIPPALLSQPVRSYPLRPINEPAIFVMGDKKGQTVYPHGSGPSTHAPPPQQPIGVLPQNAAAAVLGLNPQAMLAQQNSNMEVLERRSQAIQGQSHRGQVPGGMGMGMGAAQQRPPPTRLDDDDSSDETELISTRTLALTRYRRNHELMSEVFQYAATPDKERAPPTSPYSIFDKSDVEAKIAKLTAEIEELQRAAESRKTEAKAKAAEIEQREIGAASKTGDILMEVSEAESAMVA